ncbi:MAG: hypothetical protein LC631_01995 [Desulfovibrionales bacterium]|nr:hypothetical protein [Desulfovibrionales bacterium]
MEIDPILLLTAFAGGYLVSHWQCRHHLLINLALRAEIMGMRRKVHCDQSDKTSKVPPYKRKLSRRLPRMPWWAKAFVGFLQRFCPWAVSYNQFHPGTMNAWAKKLFLTSTYISLQFRPSSRKMGILPILRAGYILPSRNLPGSHL